MAEAWVMDVESAATGLSYMTVGGEHVMGESCTMAGLEQQAPGLGAVGLLG